MTRPQACPDESTLWDFLQDQLAGADAQRIDDHLGGCPACQRVLDRLVGSLPGRWLPDRDGIEGDAPHTHTVSRSLGRLRDPTDDLSAADTKSDPAAGDPQAAVGSPAPRTGGSDPPGNDDLAAGGDDDSHALFPPERPRTIGRYRVIRPLGRGGFGRVYLAQDDDLDRRVAIKVPNPERMARPADIASFLAEGRILARLDHPHIVPVFDAGRTEAGVGFVVSKLIEGSDLATRIGQDRPSFRETAELIATLAEALHYAHTHGLVHRDVKPANILIDRTGRAYLADFGLALKDEDLGKGPGFAGTPAYMSPEQARGEGHRVDGRSDLFSLGLVLYELLTGRRAFRGDSWRTVLDQIIKADVRPPRQVDDAIPPELERICLKAVSKRASERYSTGRDLAEDLRHFLQAAAAGLTPSTPVPVRPPPGSTQEAAATPARGRLDSDPQTVQVVPKGLRSFDQHDADFFLELLPGPRDRDGLPESLRFWKTRIESTDPDRTFRVGLIYGPSGCGKSSLVQAGLLPRLGKHVLPVYIEATAGETEPRLLRGLRKVCPEVDARMELVAAAAAVRRGQVLPSHAKVLLVLDQFEQWLFARRGELDTELIATLRQCDGAHVQALVMVRDDFWLAASRFMRDLEIRLVEGENSALVDLFDPLHARKVLGAFGRAYGVVPAGPADLAAEPQAFLDQAVAGLAQDGKIISVRLALFAEMVKGKPWTPATLRQVGGTEGVGVTFLEETFSAATAPAEHRLHQKAAQAVLKALLPPSGSDIKGQMRSESELRAASGYASRPRDFEDLVRILDPELRLITPTDPEDASDEGQAVRAAGQRYYQLTHDYLVHSLRDWLTRKQRETRRGRAELRLADRAALWNAKPENRHLPSVLEWASIRVLTRKRDWTEPQQRMIKRAGRAHGLRALGLAAVAVALILLGRDVRRRIDEANRATFASSLVQEALHVGTAQVPGVIQALGDYRRWADPALKRVLAETSDPKEKLHASLALLPVDAGQVAYLEQRLRDAELGELPVVCAALQPHQSLLTPKLWSVLDAARPGDPHLLRSAAALALYDPEDPRWAGLGRKVAGALVTENSLVLGRWLDALRPVRGKLTSPLAAIFRDRNRTETVHSLATDILADYARDDPALVAELLMDSDSKSYLSLFPVAQRHAAEALPVFQAELAKRADPTWNDSPLDPSWTQPETALVDRIESAQGLVADRFAFCQVMPLEEFLGVAEGLKKSGYRPVRFRPYADGPAGVKLAALWTRDGRKWTVASGQTLDAIRKQDQRKRKDGWVPVDVAGYVMTDVQGQPAEHYAALWVERAGPDDEARISVGATDDDYQAVQDRLTAAKLIPRTLQTVRGSTGRTKFSGVWGRPPAATVTGQSRRDLFEGNLEQSLASRGDQLLLDVVVSVASPPRPIREQARSALAGAEKALQAQPDNLEARRSRALANLRLGATAKALEELNAVVGKRPDDVEALPYRAIALARLGQKSAALTELVKFSKTDAPERTQRFLTVVVAAELGEGTEKAVATLEAAIGKAPEDADLRYDAGRALALASQAVARTDPLKGRRLADRAVDFLKDAVRIDAAKFGELEDDPALDPVRDAAGFAAVMKAGHGERRYTAAWSSDGRFEATPSYGLDPAAHLEQCRGRMAHGYRPVSLSVVRTTPEGPPVTASVWHRPVVAEETKDHLAKRQARAAVALVRLGHADEVWPLLQHSADPRLRSFLVNWLNPLGADPRAVAAELARRDSPATHHPSPATQPMDAILFHPETSVRRALILALGTYGATGTGLAPDAQPLSEGEPLIARLLDLYRHDPDAGIHGAAGWTLRQWGQKQNVQAVDAELAQLKEPGGRRWYVNGQGQTYAVIEGPVEFRIGSPPTETERTPTDTEPPHWVVIPRRFAIADREVTVAQFQRFLKQTGITIDRYQLAPSFLQKFSPDPDGPWIAPDWYTAAHYCNWLSQQEGIPKEQWCYQPADGGYVEGMKVPADLLRRTGYRLPTEAEWEYACRSGTLTARYYGLTVELLGRYAWYQANSQEHAWGGGRLVPNDLGLADMLGNVYEWMHDRLFRPWPWVRGRFTDIKETLEYISDKNFRIIRGGTFANLPAFVRSTSRSRNTPSVRSINLGFRPARTY